jgi:hypothetical protein
LKQGKRLAIFIDKEEVLEFYIPILGQKAKPKKRNTYSRGITLLNAFAPAILHVATSSLIFVITMSVVEALFRKTRAFRSFQISHDINIAREAMAFLPCLGLWISSVHHSLTFPLECQALGSTSCSPSQLLTLDQTRMVKRHLKSKWEADS